MPDYRTQYGVSAWLLTREQIGQNLREHYENSTELPLALLRLVRKLDVLEGNQLLKGFSQRLRDPDSIRG
jgi:hypothetical protein